MHKLKCVIVLILAVSWNLCFAVYLPQQQRSTLYRPRGYLPNSVFSPRGINDFEFVPTAQGYRFSYILNDGSRNGGNFVTNNNILPATQHFGIDAKNTGLNAVGIGGRPKNRKLSPKTLQSLAG